MSAIGGNPENICSFRALPVLTDAVEKVRSVLLPRNNRISEIDPLDRSYALRADLELMLPVDPSQNPFSTASTHFRHRPEGKAHA